MKRRTWGIRTISEDSLLHLIESQAQSGCLPPPSSTSSSSFPLCCFGQSRQRWSSLALFFVFVARRVKNFTATKWSILYPLKPMHWGLLSLLQMFLNLRIAKPGWKGEEKGVRGQKGNQGVLWGIEMLLQPKAKKILLFSSLYHLHLQGQIFPAKISEYLSTNTLERLHRVITSSFSALTFMGSRKNDWLL